MRRASLLPGIALAWLAAAAPPAYGQGGSEVPVVVGSKSFTESVILGEMLRQAADAAGARAEHRSQMGGTRILWNGLIAGEIDAYPEYTGTLLQEILAGTPVAEADGLEGVLARRGIRMTRPLGFENSYALGMRADHARSLGITRISDLRAHPTLSMGFSNEFLDRGDGWRGLKAAYGLPQANVRGLDHDLAYRGVASGALDVIDLYTTDAEIVFHDLVALEDDAGYFPGYQAVILYRADLAERAPAVVAAFRRLTGTLDATTMSRLNGQVKIEGASESAAAAGFLSRTLGGRFEGGERSFWQRLKIRTLEHLGLVGISLSAAIVFAVPLGVLAFRKPALGRWILGGAGILQTVPSLALFVFMIPLLGIGAPPAVMALFLYSLLPIVQNTYAGLADVPAPIRESAIALGLPPGARLRKIELPLATRSILAGIKTSAVINVGTATLAALIGAGGYGQPILTGIRLADTGLILEGAVPAAVLALAVQAGFGLVERMLLPRSLRNGAPAGA
ncbi:MAG: glycine betaine ABC transporter substrate-binding protein [Gammaproteobacteria bacterium]